jgi:chromosome partitioning protein
MSEFKNKQAVSLLIANNKGGVGKSTLTVTIAAGLIKEGYKVLVIDADPQQSVGKWRQAAAGSEHEKDLPWVERVDSPMVGDKIKLERENYDYIITDTASNIGFAGDVAQKILLAAIKNADHILVPIGASPLDVDGSEDLFNVLQDIWERRELRDPPASVVINAVKAGTSLGREVGGYVAEHYKVPVHDTIITQREAFKKAFFSGETVFTKGDKKVVEEATQLVKEIIAVTKK